MKLMIALMSLLSTSLFASVDGVYRCQGIQHSTGKVYEVVSSPIKLTVAINGLVSLEVKQDQDCMVISETTFVSDSDAKTILTRVSAFQNGCDENDMFKNNVQLVINKSSNERVASLSVTRDYQLIEDVIVYCQR